MRPAQKVPRQVAERAGSGYCEGRRIEQRAILSQIWIHSGNEIGPACRARGTAIRRVNHGIAACRGRSEDSSCGVGVDDVGPGNEYIDRESAASIGNAAHFPVAQYRLRCAG